MMTGMGLSGALLMRMIKPMRLDPHEVHAECGDGDELDVAGGIRCIGTPGHTEGHVCYLWHAERVLFVGDAVFHLLQLTSAPIAEDHEQAAESFRKLAQLDFDVAAFGHGRPIRSGAAARFQKAAQ
jgi:glyoxylase-like metal-dependent hydrolase (beta-lactamase superfamily II)